MKENERMYKDLAWAWPIISPPEDYAAEAEQFRTAIKNHTEIPVKTILNMGCGGGHIDFHLKKHYNVTGADISPGMLENARCLNPEADYRMGDMRSARLGEEFDAVIIADSIIYMLDENDMEKAFRTAFLHLKPGGAFCTYAEELAGKFSASTHTHDARSGGASEITLIEHKWDPDPADTTFELLFIYIIKQQGHVRVEIDRHRGGLFPLATWKRALKSAGFKVHVQKPDEPGICRAFICQKPQIE